MKRIAHLLFLLCLLPLAAPTTTAAASYTTSASASPATIAPGASVTLTTTVKTDTATSMLVDLEVYSPSGQKVYQKYWDKQSFTAGQTRSFSVAWTAPAGTAAGTYTLKVGLFSSGWGSMYHWNGAAGKLTVASPTGATATPTRTPAPTATPSAPTPTPSAPTATPAAGRYFATLPPGSVLPSDAECAAAIKRRPENKRVNATYNATRGNQRLASDYFGGADSRANTQIAPRVTGNFAGTTDEILQWAACKWGVDEDMVRAQAAVESWWRQTAKGNWTTDATRCAPNHGLGVDGKAGQCPESWGLLQNRYPYQKSAWPGIESSTAFNVDVAYASWRACYEGYMGWLNDVEKGKTYAAGDAWGCVGRWYAGRWYTQPANDYVTRVKGYLNDRIWETATFQEP